MKKIFYLAIISLIFCIGCETTKPVAIKNFNGTITYKVTLDYDGDNPNINININDYRKEMGDTLKVFFKDDKYYMKHNGVGKTEIWYDNSTGIQYNLINKKDTLYADNLEKSIWKLKEASSSNQTEEILKRKCQSYTVAYDNIQALYFYDPSISIDPHRFDKHKFGFTDLYYQNCKSPYLKKVQSSGKFTYTYTALKIDTAQVPDSLFVIPMGLPQSNLLDRISK